MNNDPDFVNNFVEALGNIIKFSSRRAEYIYANREENTIADTSAYNFVEVEEPEPETTPAESTIGENIQDALSDLDIGVNDGRLLQDDSADGLVDQIEDVVEEITEVISPGDEVSNPELL